MAVVRGPANARVLAPSLLCLAAGSCCRSTTARLAGDELTQFEQQIMTDPYKADTLSHQAWMTTVAANGSIRAGLPLCKHRRSGTIVAEPAGVPAGFPVAIHGIASPARVS